MSTSTETIGGVDSLGNIVGEINTFRHPTQ